VKKEESYNSKNTVTEMHKNRNAIYSRLLSELTHNTENILSLIIILIIIIIIAAYS
jgi:hypothetical protein